jgi:hypothetical protein
LRDIPPYQFLVFLLFFTTTTTTTILLLFNIHTSNLHLLQRTSKSRRKERKKKEEEKEARADHTIDQQSIFPTNSLLISPFNFFTPSLFLPRTSSSYLLLSLGSYQLFLLLILTTQFLPPSPLH